MRSDLPDPVHGSPPGAGAHSPAPLGPPGRVLLEVPIALGAGGPRAARDVVADALAGLMSPGIVERAQLIVSELLTNSVLHSGAAAGAHATVTLRAWASRCRIEVGDPGAGTAIAPREPDLRHGGGMGLHLVEAVSECWGVIRDRDGVRRVWAQLHDRDGAARV